MVRYKTLTLCSVNVFQRTQILKVTERAEVNTLAVGQS